MRDLIFTLQLIMKPSQREVRCDVSDACLARPSRLRGVPHGAPFNIDGIESVMRTSSRILALLSTKSTRRSLHPDTAAQALP